MTVFSSAGSSGYHGLEVDRERDSAANAIGHPPGDCHPRRQPYPKLLAVVRAHFENQASREPKKGKQL
jgi:hypothetical protein